MRDTVGRRVRCPQECFTENKNGFARAGGSNANDKSCRKVLLRDGSKIFTKPFGGKTVRDITLAGRKSAGAQRQALAKGPSGPRPTGSRARRVSEKQGEAPFGRREKKPNRGERGERVLNQRRHWLLIGGTNFSQSEDKGFTGNDHRKTEATTQSAGTSKRKLGALRRSRWPPWRSDVSQ